MAWLSTTTTIPVGNAVFDKIIQSLLFNCPSSTRHYVTDGVGLNGKKKRKQIYKPVSARNTSFKRRGITGHYLNTVLAQLKREILDKSHFIILKGGNSVIDEINRIESNSSMGDSLYEVIVAKTRNDMPDAESIYYYIRNSFAHGSFEVISTTTERVYILESSKDDVVKARMRLKESTLQKYCEIAKMNQSDLEKLQRKKK